MKHKEELSNFSLQLLSMPDFMKSLRIGEARGIGRTSFVGSNEKYGVGTLEGNWQERRVTTKPADIKSTSTYRRDFTVHDHQQARDLKLDAFNMCDDIWFQNQGLTFQDLIRQGPPEEFQKNKSTLYDLTYGRTCPELYMNRRLRVVKKITAPKPETDFALEYGNLTDYGLRNFKMGEWEKEEETMRRLFTSTMYKDDFIAMPIEKITKRRSAPKLCSSSFNKILLDNKYLNTRGLPYRFMSEDCKFEVTNRKLLPIVPELD